MTQGISTLSKSTVSAGGRVALWPSLPDNQTETQGHRAKWALEARQYASQRSANEVRPRRDRCGGDQTPVPGRDKGAKASVGTRCLWASPGHWCLTNRPQPHAQVALEHARELLALRRSEELGLFIQPPEG